MAGLVCNIKRIHRLLSEEGLQVPQKHRKCRRVGEASIPAERRTAQHVDHVSVLDFQFDINTTCQTFKVRSTVDEFTRKSSPSQLSWTALSTRTPPCRRLKRPSSAVARQPSSPGLPTARNSPRTRSPNSVSRPVRERTSSIRASPGRTPESNPGLSRSLLGAR